MKPTLVERLGRYAITARRPVAVTVKSMLHRYGYELTRTSEVSVPSADLEFPVDFDADTIATIRAVQGYTMTSPERIYALCQAVTYVVRHGIPGDIVECGVWRGGSMMAATRTLRQLGDESREIYLFDTFEGMPKPTEEDVDWQGVSALQRWDNEHRGRLNPEALATAREVEAAMARTGYPREKVRLVKGMVEQTVPRFAPDTISILRLDTDYYESTNH
jgi:hypothetical protein